MAKPTKAPKEEAKVTPAAIPKVMKGKKKHEEEPKEEKVEKTFSEEIEITSPDALVEEEVAPSLDKEVEV